MGLFSRLRDIAQGRAAAEEELGRMELAQARELAERAERGEEAAQPLGPVVRRRYRFVGTVQGVGFRWTCTNLANSAGAKGWVRNERDGSVTAEIQGVEEQLEAVLDGLDAYYNRRRFSMGGFKVSSAEDLPPTPDERGFEPRY